MLQLITITRKFSNASLHSKVMLFKANRTQIYGCPLWSAMFKYSYNNLRVAYNDACRLLLKESRWCSASKLFVLHSVMSFDAMIRKLVYSFWTSLRCCDNAVVYSSLNSDTFDCSQTVGRWYTILFNF